MINPLFELIETQFRNNPSDYLIGKCSHFVTKGQSSYFSFYKYDKYAINTVEFRRYPLRNFVLQSCKFSSRVS